jgi:hypothetical protein
LGALGPGKGSLALVNFNLLPWKKGCAAVPLCVKLKNIFKNTWYLSVVFRNCAINFFGSLLPNLAGMMHND